MNAETLRLQQAMKEHADALRQQEEHTAAWKAAANATAAATLRRQEELRQQEEHQQEHFRQQEEHIRRGLEELRLREEAANVATAHAGQKEEAAKAATAKAEAIRQDAKRVLDLAAKSRGGATSGFDPTLVAIPDDSTMLSAVSGDEFVAFHPTSHEGITADTVNKMAGYIAESNGSTYEYYTDAGFFDNLTEQQIVDMAFGQYAMEQEDHTSL
jgi:hypothetical protein